MVFHNIFGCIYVWVIILNALDRMLYLLANKHRPANFGEILNLSLVPLKLIHVQGHFAKPVRFPYYTMWDLICAQRKYSLFSRVHYEEKRTSYSVNWRLSICLLVNHILKLCSTWLSVVFKRQFPSTEVPLLADIFRRELLNQFYEWFT